MSVPARMTPSSKASCAASVPSGSSRLPAAVRASRGEQVAPLLLDAGYFVVDAASLCAYLGGCGDEEAPSGEDPPLDIGQIALAQGEQTLPSRLGRAEGWCDDFGDEAVPGCVDGRQLELFFGAEQGMHAALGQAGCLGEPADGQPLQAFDRRQLRRLLDDAGTGALPRCPGPPGSAAGPGLSSALSSPPALDLRRTIVYKYCTYVRLKEAAMPSAEAITPPMDWEEAGRGMGSPGHRLGLPARALRPPGERGGLRPAGRRRRHPAAGYRLRVRIRRSARRPSRRGRDRDRRLRRAGHDRQGQDTGGRLPGG